MLTTAILLLALSSSDPDLSWLVVDAPNGVHWKFDRFDSRSCRPYTAYGLLDCRFGPRSFRRRWVNSGLPMDDQFRIDVRVEPLFCSMADIEAHAIDSLIAESRHDPQPAIGVERPAPNLLRLRSDTRRVAYVSTSTDLIRVRLGTPNGPTAADDADFDAVIASARELAGPAQRVRRARWLIRNAAWEKPHFSTCGMTKQEMRALAVGELQKAAQEDPGAWEPWSLRGEEAEARAGGPDVLAVALAGELPVRPRSYVAAEAQASGPEQPLDPVAAREAAGFYAEAVRRDPPRPRFALFSRFPLDRSTILTHQARAHLLLGEEALAEAAWRDAVDRAALGSWGYFEAAFFSAERAYARGDRPEARRLYDLARRGYWAFYESDLIQSGHGPAMLTRIERRRQELWNDCRVFGPILSTTRPGCARGDAR